MANFSLGGGGGVVGDGSYPRIGYSWQNGPKILEAQLAVASQIVSHTLHVWRLVRSEVEVFHNRFNV